MLAALPLTEFNPPTSTLGIIPGDGLSWKGSNADITVHGDFSIKKWIFSSRGSFTATVSGVAVRLGVDIGKGDNGRPSIAARGCSSDIDHVDLKFHGGMSWLYNMFKRNVGGIIKTVVFEQMCKEINKKINDDGEKILAKLKVTTPLAKKFLLDYRLTQKPSFQTQYMETFHKGEIFWLSSPTTESPLIPPPMPTNTDTDSMLYLWVSDYMFDTIGYTAQKHGFLVYNITQKNLPPCLSGLLDTTCDGFKCIGKIIPETGEKFPNSVVEIRMTSTQAPTMNVSSDGMSLNFAGKIDFYATKPGTSSTPFLLSLNAIMSTTVNVTIENKLLYARVDDLNLKLKFGKSAVGKFDDVFLDSLIKVALDVYVITQLNDLGKKGFPLPVSDKINFENTKISFAKPE
ncbi:lipopolysaccharide-binding protein-like [Mercenaria mercenaria]|uniref:lipopolysaccharide-binding protein-like n=1 Tax=Mercenaria mercenaria TaxID=6596 RepID=UPI00234F166C|nr:lipopolysaccharide-binding protein-like [Mercenaria mercenaria]